MSKQSLKMELLRLKTQIEIQQGVVQAQADDMKIPRFMLRDNTGNYVVIPLLAALSNVLLALSNLEEK